MSELSYTPGPWKYWPNCCRDGGMVTGPHGGHVCAPTWFEARPDWTESNARLIAAAPELLDALKNLVEWTKNAEEITRFTYGGVCAPNVTEAINAIAKAEGRS